MSVRHAWQAKLVARIKAPDDDAGRADLLLAVHHTALLGDEAVKRIVCWVSLWVCRNARQMAFAERTAVRPLMFKAQTLGWHLRLTDAERTALRIRTIRAIDLSVEEMIERRKRADRRAQRPPATAQ